MVHIHFERGQPHAAISLSLMKLLLATVSYLNQPVKFHNYNITNMHFLLFMNIVFNFS